uniref:RING-type domain-containing protein n=1 Tax=Chelydra serpentina TaxID=8475 RepID=A0A8C3SHB6_CHESE
AELRGPEQLCRPHRSSGSWPSGSPQACGIRGLERLREDVTCSICLDVLDDPVSIECGHNFCRGCLSAHWSRVSAQGPRCPECRAPCSRDRMIPDTRVKNLVEKITELLQEEPEPVRPDGPDKGKRSFLLAITAPLSFLLVQLNKRSSLSLLS